MDKMRMESVDMTAQNIDRIAELFPNCITEALDEEHSTPEHKVYKKVVNFELLKQMLSGDVLEGDEAYEFTWVGKKAAIVEANKPIRKTLRPCPEESVDWDTTENLYIEGDNLDVLKLLQESYLGKVKMIYIDPPYNTGSDSFVYADNFAMEVDEYEEEAGLYDAEGNRLFKENNMSNPRFHSDWLSMMYSRLMLARNLLSDDGVIFISIDENEVDNLQKVCNEVFGEKNYAATFIWTKTSTPPALSYKCRKTVEYVLAYEKKWSPVKYYGSPLDGGDVPLLNTGNPPKTLLFPAGSIHFTFVNEGIVSAGVKDKVELLDELHIKNGLNENAVRFVGEFKWEQNTLNEEVANGTYFVIKTAKYSIRFQRQNLEDSFKTPTNFLNIELNKEAGVGTNESAVKELADLGLGKCFDYTKPYSLIQTVANMICKNDPDATILDFFSGSATTAQAIMDMNASDGGKRKFIMVQLPEETADKSVAKKMGFSTICEIGKERIRRAGKKIKESNPMVAQNIDTGFRVLKLDESNMNDVYYSAGEYHQDMLSLLETNVKSDRSDLDLLFGCLLEWGLPLSMPYTSEQIEGCTVHTYNDGDLIACFDENIPDAVVKEIAKRQPLRAVFRDSSFNGSPAKINVGEIFKMLAPDTRIKVI
jgi:adenine-specific DNA-methyltransferase